MSGFLTFQSVSFTYDSLGEALIKDLTVRFPAGWTGIVGPNGSGKTTLLRLATGEIAPQSGRIHRPGTSVYCPQRTDVSPAMLAEFLASDGSSARELRGRLDVQEDYVQRWATLSHGERKRAQIAVALWRHPAVLAIDEPSNHIDAAARDLLTQRLAEYDGVGLLVSHDRELLDRLCEACMFVDPPTAVLRPGNYTRAFAQHKMDQERLCNLRDEASQTVQRLRREMIRRREKDARHHKTSKRGLASKDHDAKGKIDLARMTDSKSGAPLRQLKGRMEQALEQLAGLAVKNQSEVGIFLEGCRSQRDFLFRLAGGSIELGSGRGRSSQPPRMLEYPELQMRPVDRVALTGPNGAGKSTLIEHIVGRVNLPADKLLYIPQELHADQAGEILKEIRALGHEQLGWAMNIISRLGSTPQRVLQTELPSPGEARKLLLALGLSRQVHLIIMDEPTNHMDLPSIQCLEEALSQCPCALLLVSHDEVFLKKLTHVRWDIHPDGLRPHRTRVQILEERL